MKRTYLLTGTRDSLAGEDVGAVNVWERPGLGLSVRLVLEGGDRTVAVGGTFEIGGHTHRLVAIESHGPTGGYEVVIEGPDLEGGGGESGRREAGDGQDEPVLEGIVDLEGALVLEDAPAPSEAARRPATERPPKAHAIPPTPALEVADRLRALTPAVWAALGADRSATLRTGLEVVTWRSTSRDRYTAAGAGERLGPSTRTRHVADLEDGAGAEVTTDVVRWSPREVSSVTVTGSWHAGGLEAWIMGIGSGDAPLEMVSVRAPAAVEALLLDALREPE